MWQRNERSQLRIAIIGAGFGGISTAVELTKAGFSNFVVFDSERGPGGTWWINDYPGAEVDVHSSIYSLSFKDYNWSRTHARQPEILTHIHEVLNEFDLRKHIRFNTVVDEVRWNEQDSSHTVLTSTGEELRFDVVISAVGMLSDPKDLTWRGLDEFRGEVFHSSQWRHDLDLAGKRVAVVGVGSTSAQIVPAIAPEVEKLYVFQREPGWVLPKKDREYSAEELAQRASRRVRRLERFKLMMRSEWAHIYQPWYRSGSKRNVKSEQMARRYIAETFAERPDLQTKLTPTYIFGGKRRVMSDDFYPAMLRDNVELVPFAVDHLTPTGIVDTTGVEHPVDIIVAAIGFKASTYLSSLEVRGTSGRSIHETWKDGAFAFLGITVPGFPNFYMLYGPNTNGGGPITAMLEQQAIYIVKSLKTMTRRKAAWIDARPSATRIYNRWVQSRMQGTAWLEGNNYFKGPRGQIVTQWADGVVLYGLLTRILRRPGSKMQIDRRVSRSKQPGPAANSEQVWKSAQNDAANR